MATKKQSSKGEGEGEGEERSAAWRIASEWQSRVEIGS